jgi:hypothetical protein
MSRTSLRSGAGAAASSDQRRPHRIGRLAAFAGIPVSAMIALAAVPAVAQAATASGPSASAVFAAPRVSSGSKPVLKFTTSDVSAGSVIYLEVEAAGNHSWQFVGRIRARSGAVQLPADPAGHYEYRLLVADGNTAIATSRPASLTVTAPTAQPVTQGSSCTACRIVNDVVPWLAPFVMPIIASAAQQVGSAILGWLALLFA